MDKLLAYITQIKNKRQQANESNSELKKYINIITIEKKMNEWMNEWMKDWMNEGIEHISEWMNKWKISEWLSEWMSE